ncbi:MAG: DUF1588 domain-containing protein, partial [Myxococcota bacterium]
SLGCSGVLEDPPLSRPEIPDDRPRTPEDRRCDNPGPGDHPLRRLTTPQYLTAVGRLFPGVTLPGDLQLPAVSVANNGYDNDANLAAPIAEAVTAYHETAIAISTAATEDTSWMTCELSEAECVETTLLAVAEEAFRHPLDAEQSDALRMFVAGSEEGPQLTLALGLQALLESPEFLYFPESGADGDAPEGMRVLTTDEYANRLALFLWDEPADAQLRADVAASDDIEALVETMLADPRAEAGFERFASQWMPLRESGWGGSYGRDDELSTDQAFLDDLRASALRFLRYAFLEATVEELLTSRMAFVNDRIAPIFGIAPPGSDELVAVELPAAERGGVLTHPAVLATAPADATFYSVYRGVMVMNQVLCIPPGLPQFDMIDVSEGAESGRTSRERLEQEHLDESCRGCHEAIDGIGFAFGHYDALGRFRETEIGIPIDATGNVFSTEIDGAMELGAAIAEREEVLYCITEHLYSYAVGRSVDDSRDLCQVQQLADDFVGSGGQLRGLARAMTTSNAFRFMLVEESL